MSPAVSVHALPPPLTLISRARGCLIGLAVGDALGSPTEGKSPEAIRRLFGRVEDFLSVDQPGSDDTEHALFNAAIMLRHAPHFSAEIVAEEWKRELVGASNALKGAGFSEMMAIRNLKAGLMPPRTGMHAHAWSDGVAMRVAPFGIVAAGDPGLAARLAAADGSVSNAGEGIFGGQAVAAAVAAAMGGESLAGVLAAARAAVPEDSWTWRAIGRAVAIGSGGKDVWSSLAPLHRELVCTFYPWSDLAPEAVGLALGVVTASRGLFHDAVVGGVNVGRDTDTIAAIAGAITGAMVGVETIPAKWTSRVNTAAGVCLKAVAGMKLDETADRLAALAQTGITLS